MTTTTQISSLQALGSLEQKPTGMLKKIDERLNQWADWKAGAGRCAAGGGCNPIATLMASGGVMARSTNPDAGGMPDDVYDTDQAVNKLAEPLQTVVLIHYLNTDLIPRQKFERVGVSKPTYYRRLSAAHRDIQFLLKPNKPLRSRSGLADQMKGKRVRVAV